MEKYNSLGMDSHRIRSTSFAFHIDKPTANHYTERDLRGSANSVDYRSVSIC